MRSWPCGRTVGSSVWKCSRWTAWRSANWSPGCSIGPVDSLAVARVWEQTRGNALFCRELVRAAIAAGALDLEAGVWRWRGGLPRIGRVWDLIDARLSELDPDDLGALELIAVADGADALVLDGLVDPASRVGLARRGLVDELHDGSRALPTLSHPLFGEAIRARMPAVRRREVCARLADAAEERGLARGPELLRVAGWRLECGISADPWLLVAAARRAQAGFDARLAERFAREAQSSQGLGSRLSMSLRLRSAPRARSTMPRRSSPGSSDWRRSMPSA